MDALEIKYNNYIKNFHYFYEIQTDIKELFLFLQSIKNGFSVL